MDNAANLHIGGARKGKPWHPSKAAGLCIIIEHAAQHSSGAKSGQAPIATFPDYPCKTSDCEKAQGAFAKANCCQHPLSITAATLLEQQTRFTSRLLRAFSREAPINEFKRAPLLHLQLPQASWAHLMGTFRVLLVLHKLFATNLVLRGPRCVNRSPPETVFQQCRCCKLPGFLL